MIDRELLKKFAIESESQEELIHKIERYAVTQSLIEAKNRIVAEYEHMIVDGEGLTQSQITRILEALGGTNEAQEESAPHGQKPGERTIDIQERHDQQPAQ